MELTKNEQGKSHMDLASSKSKKRLTQILILVKSKKFLAVFLPLAFLAIPHVMTNMYYLGIVNYMILYTILCMGLNLILGYAGLLSLGHAAFYGLGGYTTAILITRYGFGFLPCLILSGIVALLFGMLLGLPTRKVRGDYFCLLTIAFGEIFRLVAQAWIELTNGAMGIVGIPIPSILGWSIRTEIDFYYLGLMLLGFTYVTISLLVAFPVRPCIYRHS